MAGLHEKDPGDGGGPERSFRVARWFAMHPRARWREVVARWEVSRPTAYRWIAAWKAAGGDEDAG